MSDDTIYFWLWVFATIGGSFAHANIWEVSFWKGLAVCWIPFYSVPIIFVRLFTWSLN